MLAQTVENGGEVPYWLVLPGVPPEEWPVILNEGRGPLWEFHPTSSCSRFVLEVCTGSTGSYYFSDLGDFVSPSERGAFLPQRRAAPPVAAVGPPKESASDGPEGAVLVLAGALLAGRVMRL